MSITRYCVDTAGNFLGTFVDADLPEGAIEVQALPDDGRRIWDFESQAFLDLTPLAAFTKVFKADIWRRANDDEAVAIDAMLNSQPVRLRRMWNDTTFLSVTDDLFPLIYAGAVQLFGAARADELLQPTE